MKKFYLYNFMSTGDRVSNLYYVENESFIFYRYLDGSGFWFKSLNSTEIDLLAANCICLYSHKLLEVMYA